MTNSMHHTGASHAWIMALVLAAVAAPACAQGSSGLLRRTPSEQFNDEDARLFSEATKKALTEAAVGESVKWANPATESHGELKVLKEFAWKDNPCRELRISNEAKGVKATNAVNMCRVADKWRLLSPTELERR